MTDDTDDDPGTDLGHSHTLRWAGWHPDRELNPGLDGIPDVEKYAALITHRTPDGRECLSVAVLAGDVQARIDAGRSVWDVVSWEPLTLSPSLLCRACGDHGFVRGGQWEPA